MGRKVRFKKELLDDLLAGQDATANPDTIDSESVFGLCRIAFVHRTVTGPNSAFRVDRLPTL